jgi:hypothetical protein
MSDVAAAETVESVEQAEAPVREPLSSAEYEKRLNAATRDLRENRAETRALREMIGMIQARPQLAAEMRQDEAEPDLENDPIGWMKYAKKELDTYKGNARQQEIEQKAANERNNAQNQIARQMNDYERDFRLDHPDYDDAVAHFRKVRAEELAEEGLGGQELNNTLVESLVSAVARAIRAGKDPAEVVYKLAKNRGFGVDETSKKLQTISRASEAGKSLSTTGGRAGDGELTFEYVNTLKGKAFTEGVAKLKAQAREAERTSRRA